MMVTGRNRSAPESPAAFVGGIMEIQVEHLGSVQFEIKARQHTLVSDQPSENGGFDEGMTPPELLLASLGSCAAFYAAQYLRKHNLATEGTVVRVSADKVKDPARLDNFRIALEIPCGLDQKDLEGIEQSVQHCLIHNTLLHSPAIAIEVKAPELVVV
jgi:putative redox protein